MTRRHLFGRGALGIGAAALASLINPASGHVAADSFTQRGVSGGLHFAPRAKRIIYIFQAGGPAQMEMFDYKPDLVQRHGQELPPSV